MSREGLFESQVWLVARDCCTWRPREPAYHKQAHDGDNCDYHEVTPGPQVSASY